MKLNRYIDHTILKPTATPLDIKNLCVEAKEHQFFAICVNGSHVVLAKSMLNDSSVKIAATIGFPLGAMSTKTKVFEARECIENGADEIDMVINIGWLKSEHFKAVEDEIAEVKKAIGDRVLKVIIETCYLTEEEKIAACHAALNAKADFVKTSTGFAAGGATLEDVKLMKNAVRGKLQVKASGGIKDAETAQAFVEAGADRLGTSAGIALISPNEQE